MYSSIVEITQNREFLDSIRKGWSYGSNLDLLSSLPSYNECLALQNEGDIRFDLIFSEPLGYYLIKCFLMLNCNDDKAVFVSDVKLYKSLTDPSARLHISKKIYMKYCHTSTQSKDRHMRGMSVFESISERNYQHNYDESKDLENVRGFQRRDDAQYMHLSSESRTEIQHHNRNAIDVYGECIDECRHSIFVVYSSSVSIFDAILEQVLIDLRDNVFPSFVSSSLYRLYIQCMNINLKQLSISDFHTLRVLGRGAFGFVNAAIKKNTGHIYAMKCINKKRVMATDSVETIMSERNFLSDMNSNFVTGLKYAVMDGNTLYLIIDLMVGGDLKFHLNKEGRFNIERSRFYAAEVLLGLNHIHSKGIIYRDIKLENVLLDSSGHCKISDLGLAVRTKEKVRGYAGTPGYTAPEVCLQQSYDKRADFFSLGVMIYRFLSGRKPFQIKGKTKEKKKDVKKDNKGHRTGNELDKNVVEIEPEYPDRYFTPSARSLLKGLMCKNPQWRLAKIKELKHHPWFATKIDFGLLESGNLNPPFIPNQDEINADSLRHIGRPPNDDKYKDVKLTKHFEKSLAKFPYFCNIQQQKEIVDVLKKIKKYYSFQTFMNIINQNENINPQHVHEQSIIHKLAHIASTDELNAFAQNAMNNKHKYGVNVFIPQYYRMNKNERMSAYEDNGSIGHHYDSLDQYKLIKEEEEETETLTTNHITESSVSHTNDIQDMKPTKHEIVITKPEQINAKESNHITVNQYEGEPLKPTNTNQCMSCVIL